MGGSCVIGYVMTRIVRVAACAVLLWPALGMGTVSLQSLLRGRPASDLSFRAIVEPPDLLMGLLISLGVASVALVLLGTALAVWSIGDTARWPSAVLATIAGYALGSTAGLLCFYLVGGGTGTADRGFELFVRYQMAAAIALVLAAAAIGLARCSPRGGHQGVRRDSALRLVPWSAPAARPVRLTRPNPDR
jgi:hypothetical protein